MVAIEVEDKCSEKVQGSGGISVQPWVAWRGRLSPRMDKYMQIRSRWQASDWQGCPLQSPPQSAWAHSKAPVLEMINDRSKHSLNVGPFSVLCLSSEENHKAALDRKLVSLFFPLSSSSPWLPIVFSQGRWTAFLFASKTWLVHIVNVQGSVTGKTC